MKTSTRLSLRLVLALAALSAPTAGHAQSTPPGSDQEMGQQFHITPDSLPAPGATPSVAASPELVPRGDHLPLVPAGFAVNLYLGNVPDPRRLAVDDEGTVYVASQSAGQIFALRDTNHDGKVDQAGGVLQGVTQPYGLAFYRSGPHAGDLVLSDVGTLYRLPIIKGGNVIRLSAEGSFGKPAGHITRSVAIDPTGTAVYVGIGSTDNVGEGEEPMKATIQSYADGGTDGVTFASGLRNVTGLAFQPGTGDLYAVTMERDGMGDELVPDFLTRVAAGDNYGWPYQYIGGNAQPEFAGKGLKLKPAKVPDVLFAAHSAPLDLAFVPKTWPAHYRGGAIVALHGSWNSGTPRGYKLVFVPFENGRPVGTYENFMTGFWVEGADHARVWGRPAALAFTQDGALLVADDAGGTIWRVTPGKG